MDRVAAVPLCNCGSPPVAVILMNPNPCANVAPATAQPSAVESNCQSEFGAGSKPEAPRLLWIAPTLLFRSVMLCDWLVFTPSTAVTRLVNACTADASALVATWDSALAAAAAASVAALSVTATQDDPFQRFGVFALLVVSIPVSYTHLTLPTIAAECRSRGAPYH